MRLHYFPLHLRSLSNRVRYGKGAPRFMQTIAVSPHEINCRYQGKTQFRTHQFGKVKSGDWDLQICNQHLKKTYQSCRARFVQRIAWSDTEVYQSMLKTIKGGKKIDGCRNEAELQTRYDELDDLYRYLQSGGEFLNYWQMYWKNRRSRVRSNNFILHIGRGNQYILHSGNHRIAIAKILNLPTIPIMVGWVHPANFDR